MKYTIIGSALSGNKGAASMLETSIQTISQEDANAEITLLSMYPLEDAELNTYKNLQIISATPLQLGLLINPLCLLYKLLPPLRPILKRNKQVNAIADSDVFLDQGGVTFVDGREKFLIYNVASILPAIFTKTPVIKCSQALGSFDNKINRFFAKAFLPKVHTIFARGKKTFEHLQSLGLTNIEQAADYAFTLQVSDSDHLEAKNILAQHNFSKSRKNLGFYPSQVLRNKSKNYDIELAKFLDKITANNPNLDVYILAHSQRKDPEKLHNNDTDVCKAIYQLTSRSSQIKLVEEYISPKQMRAITSNFDYTVAARFHAMVSSIAMGVPTLVTTWSHKYKEVLAAFEVEECAYEVEPITHGELLNKFNIFVSNSTKYSELISVNLDQVLRSSNKHAKHIVSVASES